jgi:hypothetical protein
MKAEHTAESLTELAQPRGGARPGQPGRIIHRLAAYELSPEAIAQVAGGAGGASTHTGVTGGPGDTDSGFPPMARM